MFECYVCKGERKNKRDITGVPITRVKDKWYCEYCLKDIGRTAILYSGGKEGYKNILLDKRIQKSIKSIIHENDKKRMRK
jgi:hypothetical protein